VSNQRLMELLVVDDDAGHAELVRRNLVRAKILMRTTAIDNGADALDYVRRLGPYADRPESHLLVLLDLRMPGMDGLEVLRRLKGDPATRPIPVVVLTTSDDPREVRECYELGCSCFIRKPVDAEQFIEAIRRLGLFLAIISVPDS